MTRHGRNATASAVYTYHEKKKDSKSSGFGSEKQRLGKDAVKDFDCCSLSLQPCRNPVITRDGFIYDKEAILEYIIKKKNDYSRKLKEYQKQKQKDENEKHNLSQKDGKEKVAKFLVTEHSILSKPVNAFKGNEPSTSASISNMVDGKHSDLPSFWIPTKTPQAKESSLKKPDKTVYCPMSGKPLKVKDLIEVKFKIAEDPDDKRSLIARQDRYKCAVTGDLLGNSVPCAVLRPTGDVVTMDCIERIIKKDMLHPITGQKLTNEDIIPIDRGGTGFSSTNTKLEGTHKRPVLQA